MIQLIIYKVPLPISDLMLTNSPKTGLFFYRNKNEKFIPKKNTLKVFSIITAYTGIHGCQIYKMGYKESECERLDVNLISIGVTTTLSSPKSRDRQSASFLYSFFGSAIARFLVGAITVILKWNLSILPY